MSELAVELKNVSLTRRGGVVLDRVSLTVAESQFVAVIGPNGGGKTTLLKVILGLFHPDRGSVRVKGRMPEDARGLVGYVPQYFQIDPDFPATVLDLTLMGRMGRPKLWRAFTKEDVDRSLTALEQMDLADLAHRQLGSLSGGQLQRALIARALAVEPEVFLLDEPTAGLDTRIGRSVYERLQELSRRAAVVMVSHDIGVISRHVEVVACLNRTLHQHPVGEVTGEVLEEVYGCPIELVAHGHPHRVLDQHSPSEAD